MKKKNESEKSGGEGTRYLGEKLKRNRNALMILLNRPKPGRKLRNYELMYRLLGVQVITL